jgi:PIN domain nuclease of toxin-antitoxin system
VKLLLDTNMLLFAAAGQLPDGVGPLLDDKDNDLFFSPVSLWEVVIKSMLGRADFVVDPTALYQGLLSAGYRELAVTSRHTLQVAVLPPIHNDPFDRLLVAQAIAEDLTLLTADQSLSAYPGSIMVFPRRAR